MQDDPFAELGLDRNASVSDLRAARRRLAQQVHPDRGGDAVRMQRVNVAFDRAMAEVGVEREVESPLDPGAADGSAPAGTPHTAARFGGGQRRSVRGEWEAAAFVIELPVPDAFDALLVVTSWIGELASDEPPDALDVLLAEPAPCWCRLELLPEGRATSVSMLVAPAADEPSPPLIEVRDTWIAHLNQLARWEAE